MKKTRTKHILNETIRGDEIRLSGKSLESFGIEPGIYPTGKALGLALENDADLILINTKTKPVVCTIQEYSKFVYQQKKKDKKPKQKDLKTVTIKCTCGEHDLIRLINKAKEFLQKGHEVKILIRLRRGRTGLMMNPRAYEIAKVVSESLEGVYKTKTKLSTNVSNVSFNLR